MTNKDDCREAFEAWLNDNGTYKDGEGDCWAMFQDVWGLALNTSATIMADENGTHTFTCSCGRSYWLRVQPFSATSRDDWERVKSHVKTALLCATFENNEIATREELEQALAICERNLKE